MSRPSSPRPPRRSRSRSPARRLNSTALRRRLRMARRVASTRLGRVRLEPASSRPWSSRRWRASRRRRSSAGSTPPGPSRRSPSALAAVHDLDAARVPVRGRRRVHGRPRIVRRAVAARAHGRRPDLRARAPERLGRPAGRRAAALRGLVPTRSSCNGQPDARRPASSTARLPASTASTASASPTLLRPRHRGAAASP